MSNQAKTVLKISPMFTLFVVFLVLRLTEVIDWSYWWVTAPLWAPAAVAVAVLAIWGLVVLLIGIFAIILELLP